MAYQGGIQRSDFFPVSAITPKASPCASVEKGLNIYPELPAAQEELIPLEVKPIHGDTPPPSYRGQVHDDIEAQEIGNPVVHHSVFMNFAKSSVKFLFKHLTKIAGIVVVLGLIWLCIWLYDEFIAAERYVGHLFVVAEKAIKKEFDLIMKYFNDCGGVGTMGFGSVHTVCLPTNPEEVRAHMEYLQAYKGNSEPHMPVSDDGD